MSVREHLKIQRTAKAAECATIVALTSNRMAMHMADPLHLPLTELSEDERLFRDGVYEFADREVRPLVRGMEDAVIHPEVIEKLFGLGVMGIEVPESLGGAGASFCRRGKGPRRVRGF
jgi:hypothetical protein